MIYEHFISLRRIKSMFGIKNKIKKKIKEAIIELVKEIKEAPKEISVGAEPAEDGKIRVKGSFNIKF